MVLSLASDEIGTSVFSLAHIELLTAETWICPAPDLHAKRFDFGQHVGNPRRHVVTCCYTVPQ